MRENILNEAYQKAISSKRRTVALGTGLGKTCLGLRIIKDKIAENPDAKILIVIPKLSIKDTWLEEDKKFDFNLIDNNNVEFTTYLSLVKRNVNYDLVIFDEIHNIKAKHADFLASYNGEILGLTGTPPRYRKSEKYMMLSLYAPIVYEYLAAEAVEDEILNDYRIYVHRVSLSSKKDYFVKLSNNQGFVSSEADVYNYWCRRIDVEPYDKKLKLNRMRALQSFASKERYAKKLISCINDKCLIFASSISQAERLCNNVYHSENPDDVNETILRNFKEGKIMTLASVNMLKEGVNIPDLKASIIMHTFSSEYVTAQRIGRLLRLPVNEVANVHILMYENTVDEQWVTNALENFNQDKIIYL